MMKRRLLILVLVFMTYKGFCQDSKQFIRLYSGKLVNTSNIKLQEKIFSESVFILNGEKFKTSDVEFYKNEEGFFANIKELNFLGVSGFAYRNIDGKINLYSKEFTNNVMTMGPNGMMMGGFGSHTSVSYYYNKGEFGKLKKSNYKNLKIDLNNNLNSMLHLKKYNSIKKRETLLYILGGSVAAIGLATFINKTANVPTEEVSNLSGSYVMFGIGFGTIITNYFTAKNKQKHIEMAIDVYNK